MDLGRDGLARASRFNRRMMGQYPAWASANAAGLRSVARFRRLDPRIQATAAAGAAMVCLLLLMWLIPDGAAGSAHAPVVVITPTPITVQVDGGLLQGEWITIWGDGYRALFQEQVTAAGSPMPVELGGMVFVPASDPTRGYYCPPPVAAVGAPAPLAPVALDGCVAIALPPRLAGTD